MYEFFEESFDLENTFENILSIQVSLNGFSFSILQPESGKVLAVKSLPLKISSIGLLARRFKDWYQTEKILHKPFQKIRFIVFGEKFTLVPEQFSSNSVKEELAHVLFQESNKLKFAENLIKPLKAKLLFALPEGLMETISETVGECDVIHPTKLIISEILDKRNNINELVLLFNNHELYLVLKVDQSIQLLNSFKINHSNDAVYFVLTVLNQMGLSSKTIKLSYAGISTFIKETERNLSKHFSSTQQLTSTNNPLPPEIINQNIALFY